MGLLRAIGLVIRTGFIATIGLLKIAALRMALPLLRIARELEGTVMQIEAKIADYEKRVAEERLKAGQLQTQPRSQAHNSPINSTPNESAASDRGPGILPPQS